MPNTRVTPGLGDLKSYEILKGKGMRLRWAKPRLTSGQVDEKAPPARRHGARVT